MEARVVTDGALHPEKSPEAKKPERRPRRRSPIAALLFFLQGYLIQITAVSAPFVAETFGLGDRAVALLLAVGSLGVVGTALLARLADRFGRRRTLRAALLLLPLPTLATAVADSVPVYAVCQILAVALTGVLALTLQVMVTEGAEDEDRAGAHGLAGLALGVGAGISFAVAPLFEAMSDAPWRSMWLLASGGSLLLAWGSRALPETERWQHATRRGAAGASRARDLLSPAYRRRTLGVVFVCLVWQLGAAATSTWIYYHPVRTLGMETLAATVLLMVVSPIGLLGLLWGTKLSNRLGRRWTFAAALCVSMLGFLGYYGAVRVQEEWLLAWLGATFALGCIGMNAANVAFRTASGELFPMRLRATVLGWVMVVDTGAATLSHFAVGGLAGELGGVGPSVCFLAVLSLGAIAVWLLAIPETLGVQLEAADLEGPPETVISATVGGARRASS